MKIVVHPAAAPEQELDLTHRLTAVIAEELRRYGGDERSSLEEAAGHLIRILDEAKAEGKRVAEKKAGPCPACPRLSARGLRLSTSPAPLSVSCQAATAC